jgi:hypothetical protein
MHLNSSNLICASLFTGVYDVNRSEMLAQDDFLLVEKWCRSIERLGLYGIIFHNNFSAKTVAEVHSEQLQFIRVDFPSSLNANVYRYVVYDDFLQKQGEQIQHIFFTDITDVEVIKSPFDDAFFLENPERLFCGDEEKILDNPWMREHGKHLRKVMPGFSDFEQKNKSQPLLNCGIIGGKVTVMRSLMNELARIHQTYTISNQTPYTLDMGAFNFAARTMFPHRLIHGSPVNTRFKRYETDRSDCWFRHK